MKGDLFDNGLVMGTILVLPFILPVFLIAHLGDEYPSWFVLVAACLTYLPVATSMILLVSAWDRKRRGVTVVGQSLSSYSGVTLPGVLKAQAVVFVIAPFFIGSRGEDGDPPLLHLGRSAWMTAIVLAGAFALASSKVKKKANRRLALARLAEKDPSLATRFLVRTDNKGWEEIQPENVLAYQDAFEKALDEMEGVVPVGRTLTDTQTEILREVSKRSRYAYRSPGELWPGVIAGLVFTYVDAPDDQRRHDRKEWAAAIGTRTNATVLRQSVEHRVRRLFEAGGA